MWDFSTLDAVFNTVPRGRKVKALPLRGRMMMLLRRASAPGKLLSCPMDCCGLNPRFSPSMSIRVRSKRVTPTLVNVSSIFYAASRSVTPHPLARLAFVPLNGDYLVQFAAATAVVPSPRACFLRWLPAAKRSFNLRNGFSTNRYEA